jgi:hypothetical protein
MRHVKYWLIDLPAKIVNVWFTVYWLLISVMVFSMLVTGLTSMVLYWFGIRWGW